MGSYGLNSSDLGQGPVSGPHEHRNVPLSSTENFLTDLATVGFLEWTQLVLNNLDTKSVVK
jgi:hypothetical protein